MGLRGNRRVLLTGPTAPLLDRGRSTSVTRWGPQMSDALTSCRRAPAAPSALCQVSWDSGPGPGVQSDGQQPWGAAIGSTAESSAGGPRTPGFMPTQPCQGVCVHMCTCVFVCMMCVCLCMCAYGCVSAGDCVCLIWVTAWVLRLKSLEPQPSLFHASPLLRAFVTPRSKFYRQRSLSHGTGVLGSGSTANLTPWVNSGTFIKYMPR